MPLSGKVSVVKVTGYMQFIEADISTKQNGLLKLKFTCWLQFTVFDSLSYPFTATSHEHHGVSNHRQFCKALCLLNTPHLGRYIMEKFPSPLCGEFPSYMASNAETISTPYRKYMYFPVSVSHITLLPGKLPYSKIYGMCNHDATVQHYVETWLCKELITNRFCRVYRNNSHKEHLMLSLLFPYDVNVTLVSDRCTYVSLISIL